MIVLNISRKPNGLYIIEDVATNVTIEVGELEKMQKFLQAMWLLDDDFYVEVYYDNDYPLRAKVGWLHKVKELYAKDKTVWERINKIILFEGNEPRHKYVITYDYWAYGVAGGSELQCPVLARTPSEALYIFQENFNYMEGTCSFRKVEELKHD